MGNHVIEQVKTYKIQDVIMSCDSKFRVEHIIKKACKKLVRCPSLRVLCRARVEKDKILKVYLTIQHDQCWNTLSRYGKLSRTIPMTQLESCIYLIIQRFVTEHSSFLLLYSSLMLLN